LMGAEVEFFILENLSAVVNDWEYTYYTRMESLEAPVTQGYPYRPKTGYYMEWGLDTVIGEPPPRGSHSRAERGEHQVWRPGIHG